MIDPNVVYLALIFGLWLGVTGAYLPGTGVIEVLALVVLGGAALALVNMPTNWLAVLLLLVGVSGFIVVPFIRREYASFALGGLVLQGVGGWILFNGLQVSPVIIGLTLLLPLLYHQFVLLPMLDKARAEPVMNEDQLLVGARGRVVKSLDPTGTIHLRGELWTATSYDGKSLPVGREVIVIERDGLQVVVEGIKAKRAELNGYEETEEAL